MEHLVIETNGLEFEETVKSLTKLMGRPPDGALPKHGLVGFKCFNKTEAEGCAKHLTQSISGITAIVETYSGGIQEPSLTEESIVEEGPHAMIGSPVEPEPAQETVPETLKKRGRK